MAPRARPGAMDHLGHAYATADLAFDWLGQSYAEHTSPLMPLIRQLPMFDAVPDEPRYRSLVRRLDFQAKTPHHAPGSQDIPHFT